MFLRKFIATVCVALVSFVGFAQCVGTFTLTKKVHRFVRGMSNKWVSWLVFLVCVIIPVYGIAMLVDGIVLNSIEFWTGGNPAAMKSGEKEYTRELRSGPERAVLKYGDYGRTLDIELYRDGHHRKTLHMDRDQPGQLFARAENGDLAQLKVDLARGPGYQNAIIWEGERIAAVRRMAPGEVDRLQNHGMEAESRALAAVEASSVEHGMNTGPAPLSSF